MTSRTPGHASITLSRNNVKPLLSTVSNRERYPPSSTTARTEGFRTATNPLHAAANAKTRTKKPFKPPVKVRAPGRNAKTTSQDDLDRSPVSSDSDDVSLKSGVAGSPRRDSIGSRDNVVDVDTLSIGIIASPKRSLRAIGNTNGLPAKSSQEFGSEDSLSGEKRKANEDPEIMVAKPGSEGEDDFGFAFSSGQNTRRARTYQRSSSQRGSQVSFTGNIHGRGGKKQTGKAVESTKKDLGSFKMPNLGENGTKPKFASMKIREDKAAQVRAGIVKPDFKKPSTVIEKPFNTRHLSKDLPYSDDRSSNLSSPPPELELDFVSSQILDAPPSPPPEPTTTPCPVCGESVATALLKAFANGRRLRFKDQDRFCQSHKSQSAADQWASHDYPTIDWEALPSRLCRFDDKMNAVLERRDTSFYRDALQDKVTKSRHSRNAFHKLDISTVPGYYGPRGAQVIMGHVMARFRTEIKSLAATDNVIPVTGVGAFVQAVLVPELAVMLIKEDMGVGNTRAREIITESASMGTLVHPEEEEEVVLSDGDGDGNRNGEDAPQSKRIVEVVDLD